MIRPPLLHLARSRGRPSSSTRQRRPSKNRSPSRRATRRTRSAPQAGVYAGDAAVSARARTPGLRSWGGWFKSPTYLKNGHAHTIFAAKFRWTASVVYRRHLLTTSERPLRLDIVDKVSDETSKDSTGATYVDGAVEQDAEPVSLP